MSERPDLALEASRWLGEAAEELHAARAVQVDSGSPGRIACFLAHLAAEKALKGMLVAQGVPIRKTHDLGDLYALLTPRAQTGVLREDLQALNPWALWGRYTDELAEADEATATAVLEAASRVLAAAREAIS